MKITVDTLSFDTVQEFTAHLEHTYGQAQSGTKEVLIRLKCEALEAEHVAQIVEYILNPDQLHIYKLQIASLKNSSAQLAFDNAYLASKRQRLALDFQNNVADLPQPIRAFQPLELPIRKSKKNWIEGTQGASLNIQIPIEEPLLTVQPTSPIAASLRKQREAVMRDEIVQKPPVPMASLGELIDRETINAKLKRFANKLFKEKAPNLQLLWDRLVGVNKKITHVQNEALEYIIRYYPEFVDGVVLDNLPAGLYLQATNEEGLVLCYSPELEAQHLDTITPLTILPELVNPIVSGSFQQFTLLGNESSNRGRYEIEFAHLFAPKIASETRLNALNFFLSELEQDPLKIRRIHNLLKFLPLTNSHYHGLAYVLVNSGADGMVLVLQQFKILHEQERFNDLHDLFLENPQSYADLATPRGLDNLKKLAVLTPEQYMWWRALVSQHKAAGVRTNFNELFDAYSYFLTGLGELAQDLPASCPLVHVKHMKPALDRALFIIKNSADPKEQLAYLHGLDFAADYDPEYRIISQHMGLISGQANTVAFKNPQELYTFFAGKPTSEEARIQFYRFIGKQDWAYGLSVYEDIEAQINAHYHLDDDARSLLLGIILLTTTGKRSCTEERAPCAAVLNLVDKMILAAKLISPELKTGLMPILLMCMGALGSFEHDHMPSLHELNLLFDTLLLNHGSAIEIPEREKANYIALIPVDAQNEMLKVLLDELAKPRAEAPEDDTTSSDARVNMLALMTLSLNLLHVYGSVGTSLLENYQARLTLAQAKTTAINSFNINLLLRHLHPTAKLGQHISECFAREPASLSQFLRLLSLINDAIPPYNGAEEAPDSEFETQVKTLVQNVVALPKAQQTILFNLLVEIDVRTSSSLPSLENLLEIVQAVSLDAGNLGTMDNIEQQATILDIIQEILPNTQIGSRPVLSLKKPLNPEDYEDCLIEAVNSLQTANPGFDDYLLNLTPEFFEDELDEELELELSKQFDELSRLINTLIDLRNNHHNDFRRCISRLGNEFTSSEQRCSFTPAQLGGLLTEFSRIAEDQVVEQLDILLNALHTHSNYSETQFDNAVQQVLILAQYKAAGIIDFAAYIKLLQLSFVHNLSRDTLFPFEQLIQIYELFSGAQDQVYVLFDAWMDVIKKIDVEQVNSVLLEQLIAHTLFVLQAFSESETAILPLMTSLIKTCKTGSVQELHQYDELLAKFARASEPVLNAWIKILTAYSQSIADDKLPLLFKLHEGLEIQEFNLAEIASLFESPPYPDLKQFIGLLNGSAKELRAYIAQYDKDPKQGRAEQYDAEFGITVIKTTEQVVQEQFDMAQVAQVVADIKNMFGNVNLTAQAQHDIVQQITYINAIGKEMPLVIKGMGKKYDDLTKVSRAELRLISDHLIAAIRNPSCSEADKLNAQLNLIAVLREQYERATGQIIYAPQLAAVVLALKHERRNLLMQIANDQDARVVNTLVAVMQWVQADGGSVDLCYAQREEMAQDYYGLGHKDFFTSVGIDSSCLKADSPLKTYKKGGINCSTMGDLAVYRQRAKQKDEVLIAEKNGQPLSTNLILCGTDLSALNDKQVFSLTADKPEEHPYAWIYPLVNEFIAQPQFKDLSPPYAWSEPQDLMQLKSFLEQHAPTGIHRAQLKNLSSEQLNGWLNSAIAAQRMLEGEDFEVLSQGANIYTAVPYSLKSAQKGMSIAQEVQQFLHVRLEKEYLALGWKFPINPARKTIAQASVKDLINEYKAQGRIIGLSKTMNADKLGEVCDQLGITSANAIPSGMKDPRSELTVAPTVNEEQYCALIHNVISGAVNNQPIVLIAQDANEVRYLQDMLTAYYGSSRTVGVLDMSNKQSWLRKAGSPNTVTITTAEALGRGTFFNTDLSEGFLTIQTSLDPANRVREFLRRISTYEKPGKYTVIYEAQNLMHAKSWSYYDNDERELMFADLELLRHKRQEVIAIQHVYNQSAAAMRYVAMKQFDEWQAFLATIYAKDDLLQLNNELLLLKDNLACNLSEKWQECITSLGQQEHYMSLYDRKDPEGQSLLLTGFQEAMHEFEQATVAIWQTTCTVLRAKAAELIEPGSLNELRSNYLANMSISEQFRLHEIEELKKENATQVEKEKAQRYVAAGLDVNGAMMRYSDDELSTYRAAYTKNQVKSLQQHISKVIANESALSKSVRDNLLIQINYADTLNALILFLNSYVRWFAEEDFEKKYAMQPAIQELLQVADQVNYAEDAALIELKDIYINNVIDEITDELEHNLSWAVKGNRGLGYLLERTAVTDAANDILVAVASLRAQTNGDRRQSALKNLYKTLMQHQARLEGLWIFPLGHKNTRNLIQETLATLNSLTLIGNEQKILDKTFIQESKEQAVYYVMRDKFNAALRRLEQEKGALLSEHSGWRQIKWQLQDIQAKCDSVYALYEMNDFIVNKIAKLGKADAILLAPLTQLRGELNKMWHECEQNHQELMDESKYFKLKATKIETQLVAMNNFQVHQVSLKPGHNGFKDYLDLVIEGRGTNPALEGFVHYNSQLPDLKRMQREHAQQLAGALDLSVQLEQLKHTQIPLLNHKAVIPANSKLFPVQFQGQVNAILQLNAYVQGGTPDDLSGFPETVQHHFRDRDRIKNFTLTNLDVDEINQLHDESLKTDLINLHQRVTEAAKSQPIWKSAWSLLVNTVFNQESEEDRKELLEELKQHCIKQVRNSLLPTIKKEEAALSSQLADLYQTTLSQIQTLNDKLAFLAQEIEREEAKGAVYCKRFESVAELYQFEAYLQSSLASQTQKQFDKKIEPSEEDLFFDAAEFGFENSFLGL
ncbi:hypothetical protein [Legionella saoudiensis]|uniref:hypothetical protein n=1 Tax=Legionella saoudiensis TaxID=1750561 RepID=UPI000730CB81|nr:hypothetical protein [Legionella saoudiensis]